MSYDIYLTDPVTKATIQFAEPHDMKGGIYQLGGSREAWLNVTYNYGTHYRRVFAPRWADHSSCRDGQLDGIRSIYGLTAAESLPLLDKAIAALGDDVDADYWKATEGNAKAALCQLRAMALLRPDGIWDGD